jgi:hypothetical protein
MMATENRASCRFIQNQTVRIKAWVRMTEYHPIQQILGIKHTREFVDGASGNQHFQN